MDAVSLDKLKRLHTISLKSKTIVDQLRHNLTSLIGRDSVLTAHDELLVYECDGLPQHKLPPRAVVFPRSTEEVAEVIDVLAHMNVPFVPRGAGTGLSGGAVKHFR